MPNSHPDEAPVTWGRFEVTVAELRERIGTIELEARQREGLPTRIERLRLDVDQLKADMGKRKDRTWTLVTMLLTGLVLPLIVIGITVALHLRK